MASLCARLIALAVLALICTGTARADYTANDLAVFCSGIHSKEKGRDYSGGVAEGVCVGYIAAFASINHERYGDLNVYRVADEFAAFGKTFGPNFPAATAMLVMLERDRSSPKT